MRGFFRSLEPFLRIGLGLFAVALVGGMAQLASRWMGIPLLTLFVTVGVVAVLLAAFVTGIFYLKR